MAKEGPGSDDLLRCGISEFIGTFLLAGMSINADKRILKTGNPPIVVGLMVCTTDAPLCALREFFLCVCGGSSPPW